MSDDGNPLKVGGLGFLGTRRYSEWVPDGRAEFHVYYADPDDPDLVAVHSVLGRRTGFRTFMHLDQVLENAVNVEPVPGWLREAVIAKTKRDRKRAAR